MNSGLSKKLLFASLPTLLLLVTAETLVQLTDAAETCPTYHTSILWTCDPLLYFKARQGVAGGLNKQGFRGSDFGPKKAGTYRILALGDSCTFGIRAAEDGLIVDEPYPQRLAHLITERIGVDTVEVLNGGIPGYNTYQGIMLLRGKLRGLEPDLVTVRFGWNDHLMSPEGRIGNAFREPTNPVLWGIEDLLLLTELYPFSRRLGMELQLRWSGAAEQAPPVLPREWKPNVPLQQYEHNLRRIAAVARRQGAEVWFLTSPSALLTPELLAKYEALPQTAQARQLLILDAIPSFKRMMEIHDAYNAATRMVAAELRVPLIDMAEVYREHANTELFAMFDVVHPLQAGQDLEAESLFGRLAAEGTIVPPGDSVDATSTRTRGLSSSRCDLIAAAQPVPRVFEMSP